MEFSVRSPMKLSRDQELRIWKVSGAVYDYKVLTMDQMMRLSGLGVDPNRLSKLLRESGYMKDRQYNLMRYYDGQWHQCNRLHLWHLTPWGVGQWEDYAFLSRWGYSSGELGAYRTQNPERVVQLADVHVALCKAGVADQLEFWGTTRMLSQMGAWHAYRNREDTFLAKAWKERPTLAGAYTLQANLHEFILLGLYVETIRGFINYIQHSFPDELRRGHRTYVYVGNAIHHEALRQLQKYRIDKGDMVLLSYEWVIDHPKWHMSILEGNRESVLSPYFEWVRSQGGAVERREGASLEWRVTHASGEVEYADTTVGNSVGRIYGIVTDKDVGISELGRFRRVLYVLNAAEKKFLEAVAEKALRSIEFRVLDWPGGK